MPGPADGSFWPLTRYLSLDPYMRGRMNDAQVSRTAGWIGEVMEGEAGRGPPNRGTPHTVSVTWSKVDWLADACSGRTQGGEEGPDGWQRAHDNVGCPRHARLHGILGHEGHRQPKPGDTVVVESSKRAVARLVGQARPARRRTSRRHRRRRCQMRLRPRSASVRCRRRSQSQGPSQGW